MDGAFLTGFMLFAALFFVGLNGVFVLTEFAFATIRGAQVERLVNEGRAQIREVNEAIGSGFEAESFDTMGGLVLGLLGGRPKRATRFGWTAARCAWRAWTTCASSVSPSGKRSEENRNPGKATGAGSSCGSKAPVRTNTGPC